MDAKKISFGFSKVAKKPNILSSKQPKDEKKVELIKCLEGKEIMLVAERVEAAPLIIEMQGSQKTSAALASLMKRRAVLLGEEEPDPEEVTPAAQSVAEVTAGPAAAENLEQRAARELLAASQNNGDSLAAEKLVLPAVKADELPLDGAKEATLDDYDNIPIQQFGLAMLRGMGWVDPPPKKKGSGPIDDAPFLRPKGMGLGADKALKPKALLVQPEKNEVLEIKKQAFVRILGGKQKDQYGQIEGFDDHAGRVIVKMAIGGAKEAFNEFLCQPVSRKEYSQYGKCINTAKYEEFKKQENEHGQIILKQEKPTERRDRDRREDDRSQRDDRKEQRSYKDEDRRRYKEEDRKSYKDEDRKSYKEEERKSYKDEDRKSYKNEDRKPYKDEDRKPYKDEDRKTYKAEDKKLYKDEDRKSYKDDGRKTYRDEDRKPHREDDRKAYKEEDRKEYKTERTYKEENRSHKTDERERKNHGQDSRSNSSSTSKRDDRERRRSPSPKSSRRPKSSSDEAEDTGESTESDSDSAYERRKHKKSSSRKSRKHSKKSKGKSRRADNDSSAESDASSHEDHRRHPSKHKKKTKKSKHARSRTRSRSRGRGR